MAASQKALSLLRRCINKTSNHAWKSNRKLVIYQLRYNQWGGRPTIINPRYTRNQIYNVSSTKLIKSAAAQTITTANNSSNANTAEPSKKDGNGNGGNGSKIDHEQDAKRKEAEEQALLKEKEDRQRNFIHGIMVDNKKWCSDHGMSGTNDDGITQFSFLDKQTPICTVLSCCDSRAPTSALGTEAPNEIFSVRNIGNQFCNSIGSFRYGLEVLKTPYAIIMGHTNCGAIRGAASDYRFLHTMVQQEVISLVRVIRFADSLTNSAKLDEMPFDHRCNVYAEINVDYQINRLLEDFQINERVLGGKLNLIGMMFDVHNIYNKGYGRLHVVNINGDRDILSLRQHPLLQKVREIMSDEVNQQNMMNNFANMGELEDIHQNIGDSDETVDIATRLFSYSSSAVQSSRFSHL
mmetsp:Transcript_10038/g.9032  ORF Transcript_10038/g.9032 Transcript_10038/m.9032 type:complete len:408 (-) Transcript_10038:146-1369(-)